MKSVSKSGFMKKAMKLFGVDAEKRVANAGSEDYKKLSGAMRATFVNVVNEDLRRYLRDIKSPSLMIYGEDDADTPVYFGEIMEKEIADSGLCVLKNAGHFSLPRSVPAIYENCKSIFGGRSMILSIIATVLLGVFVFLASLVCCHMFQLEGYKTSGYGRWLSHTGLSKYWIVLVLAALYLGATYAALAVQGMLGVIVSIVCVAGFAALGLYYLSAMRVKNAKNRWFIRRA